ncbi:hypothetical protein D3C74_452420 [compost metagenome]
MVSCPRLANSPGGLADNLFRARALIRKFHVLRLLGTSAYFDLPASGLPVVAGGFATFSFAGTTLPVDSLVTVLTNELSTGNER